MKLPSGSWAPSSSATVGMKAALTGTGVFMLIASFLPVIDLQFLGRRYTANIYQLAELFRTFGDEGRVGWVATAIAVIALLAIGTGIFGNRKTTIISGAMSAAGFLIMIGEAGKIQNTLSARLGVYAGYAGDALKDVLGIGLYLMIITMGIHAAMALYLGIKRM